MMDTDTPPPHCHFDKSGAAKSHSPMAGSIATGDLSTQRFNSPKVFIPIPPCPSARDDGGGRQHTVISKGGHKCQKRRLATSSFRPKRSEVEKSHASNGRNAASHSSFRRKQSSKISLPNGTRPWRQAARHHRAIIKGLWEMMYISHSPFCQSADLLISVPDAASRFPCRSFRCNRP